MMSPPILRDPDVTQKLLDAIIDTPSGKRTISRLARTCRALQEPSLATLWKELDSLIPLIGLFPPNLLKRARKPGLGLSRSPVDGDWDKVLAYGQRVRSLVYNESANNVSSNIFPMLAQNRPGDYMLPNLLQLVWKAETAAALDYSSDFLSSSIESLQLELGPTRFPSLNRILGDVCSRMTLISFSITSSVSLPDTFTVMLSSQEALQQVSLIAPGALSSGVGRWAAHLSDLKSLQLDLTARTLTAVEGFFDELPSHSGHSTPSSAVTTDSGVFSGDEPDFSSIRKSTMRMPGNLYTKAGFINLRHLHLTGDVVNISAFLRHFSVSLTQLDLVIEDPPDNGEWMELAFVISDRFGLSLQVLRISATPTSKLNELASRGEPATSRLILEHLQPLPALRRLEIDLPESINFIEDDLAAVASACPNVHEVKLCPFARFPLHSGPPKLTLEALAPLTERCRQLHTLAVPVDARKTGSSLLRARGCSSDTLRRLHVGHSWIADSLHASILLSHLAPHLDALKWFHDKNRPGVIETNARGWEKVSEILPHLQNIRLTERKAALTSLPRIVESLPPQPDTVETAEKSTMTAFSVVHRGVLALPQIANSAVQTQGPAMVNRSVDAHAELVSVSVDAVAPPVVLLDESIDTIPEISLKSSQPVVERHPVSPSSHLLPVFSLISFTWRVLFVYPMSVPLQIFHVLFNHLPTLIRRPHASQDILLPVRRS